MRDLLMYVDVLFLPIVALIVALLGFILILRGKIGKLEIGRFVKLSGAGAETERIKQRLSTAAPQGAGKASQQYALLQEYHAQGLAQSKISFWFSLIFAAIGFTIIVVSVVSHVLGPSTVDQTISISSSALDDAAKPIFAVVAGTIIDTVAALFFVQSNKARQLMTEFFDKLRVDRKLDESLIVLESIHDKTVASRVRALLALNFAEVDVSDATFRRVVAGDWERLEAPSETPTD